MDQMAKKIQLHHVLQEEAGPMAEVTETTHQNYYKTLHGLKGKGEVLEMILFWKNNIIISDVNIGNGEQNKL